ncbi:MAG: hypothetical protein ACYS7M_16535, partial [Planctomycetota bacterium]
MKLPVGGRQVGKFLGRRTYKVRQVLVRRQVAVLYHCRNGNLEIDGAEKLVVPQNVLRRSVGAVR